MQIRIESEMARRFNEQQDELSEVAWEGDVPEMSLEEVFRYFNRVDAGDGLRLEEIGYTLPSLSVGDRVTIDETTWTVAPVGWEEMITTERDGQ